MMFTWIFYVLVLSALIVLFSVMFGHFFGGDNLIPAEADAGMESAARIDANAAAVSDNRFDNISFDVVLRGYRQDQVDAVIENMRQRNYCPGKPYRNERKGLGWMVKFPTSKEQGQVAAMKPRDWQRSDGSSGRKSKDRDAHSQRRRRSPGY